MHEEDRNRFVDELLDAALARHDRAGARPGLEGRILARLREEQRDSPRAGWKWLPVLVTAGAVMLAVGAYYAARRAAQPEAPAPTVARTVEETPSAGPPVAEKPALPAPGPRRAATSRRRPRSPRVVVPAAASVPRRAQFPSPAPLSEQERLLLRYISESPREALLVAQARSRPLEELHFEKLQIPALEIERLPSAGEGQGE